MIRAGRRVRGVFAVAAVAVLLIGLALFQPWRLFVDETVDEAEPGAARSATAEPSTPSTSAVDPTPPVPTPSKSRRPTATVLATGRLVTHEHPTTGRVRIIRTADGERVLRFEDLATVSGPDLRVWLSEAPVVEGFKGWRVFADHDHVELGKLKANRGNQNYPIPADADLGELTSVTLWCKRFSVSFGAAHLER